MPRPRGSTKTPGSGRKPGTPNTATRELKAVLQPILRGAFADPAFQQLLGQQVRTLTVDAKVLALLMAYAYGAPPKEHKHSGSLTLEQAVLGTTDTEGDE